MHTKEQLIEMHIEHREWKNKLLFFRNEMNHFDRELTLIVHDSADQEIVSGAPLYKNRFRLLLEILENLLIDIRHYEMEIDHIQKHKVDKTEMGILHIQRSLKDRLEDFEDAFHDLRSDFHHFHQPRKAVDN
jgi:hypothetical protein